MTIETKYNIGDEVWFDSLGHHYKGSVNEINISVPVDGSVHINYRIKKSGYFFEKQEDVLFPNKEELLKSL